MRRAGFFIVLLVCECAVSSLVTEQERTDNKVTVHFHINALSFIDSIDILKTILILREIQDKVCSFSTQWTPNFVSKNVPFFRGRLATLVVELNKKEMILLFTAAASGKLIQYIFAF